ncbi:hypothetical protein BH20ACT24_BH20ACT24_07770 [soil metagenome]
MRRRVLLLAVGFAAGTIVMNQYTAYNSSQREPSPSSPRHLASTLASRAGFFGSGPAPFLDAVRVPTIEVAEAQLGWSLLRPDMCAANDSRITDIYVNAVNEQAYVRYADLSPNEACEGYPSGQVELVLGYSPLPGDPIPSRAEIVSHMQLEAAQMGSVASVETIAGVPALVMEGNFAGNCDNPPPGQVGCTPRQDNPASARLEFGAFHVYVYGPSGWTEAQILGVADSVR